MDLNWTSDKHQNKCLDFEMDHETTFQLSLEYPQEYLSSGTGSLVAPKKNSKTPNSRDEIHDGT